MVNQQIGQLAQKVVEVFGFTQQDADGNVDFAYECECMMSSDTEYSVYYALMDMVMHEYNSGCNTKEKFNEVLSIVITDK